MGIDEPIVGKCDDILRVAVRHGARKVRVVGSVVRGEADETSDIDFLVELEPGRALFYPSGLLMDLRALLGREVNVVTERGPQDAHSNQSPSGGRGAARDPWEWLRALLEAIKHFERYTAGGRDKRHSKVLPC